MHLDVLCDGLEGLQREACITGAAVIGPADPERQLKLCAEFERDATRLRASAARRCRTSSAHRRRRTCGSSQRCETFAGAVRRACYRWLGKTVAVLTDGAFEREGCPALEAEEARRSCAAGARSSRARS